MESNDIFDKIMQFSLFRCFYPFYIKNKESMLYLLFGGLAFFFNLVLFIVFTDYFSLNALAANAVSWVICVLFQFFTNRIWVFNGYVATKEEFIKQMTLFFGGRIFTLIIEEIILAIFISWLCFDSIIVKLIAQVIVIVTNYFISKRVVFKN